MSSYKYKTEKELIKELSEKRFSIRNFRFGMAGSKIKNVKESRNNRKDIARILTELNNRHG